MTHRIGLTGSTGSLGKTLLKNKKKTKFFSFKGDVRNRKKVFNWIKKKNINTVIHLAAIVPIIEVNRNKKVAKEVNYLGTKNLVDACLKQNIKWFFFASTSHVYKSSKNKISESRITNPISYYGETKLLAEKYIIKKFKNRKIKYCIGRIFSTTNKDQKKNYLVPDLKNRIKKSTKKIELKNLNHYRDFISMEDISNIIFKLLNKKYNGILNISNGKKIYSLNMQTTANIKPITISIVYSP